MYLLTLAEQPLNSTELGIPLLENAASPSLLPLEVIWQQNK